MNTPTHPTERPRTEQEYQAALAKINELKQTMLAKRYSKIAEQEEIAQGAALIHRAFENRKAGR